MKVTALLVCLFLAAPAQAAGVVRSVRAAPEVAIWNVSGTGGAVSLALNYLAGGYKLPADRGFTISGLTMMTAVASGGGAGSTIITFTDGTNTCTVTMACTTTNGVAPQYLRVEAANGAGTGCVFPAGANLSASVTGATCTTTQPGFRYLSFLGAWR